MTLQRVTLQTNEPVFSASIHCKTANALEKECRSHVTYNMNTVLYKEPHEKAALISHSAYERAGQAESLPLKSWNKKIPSSPILEGFLKWLPFLKPLPSCH